MLISVFELYMDNEVNICERCFSLWKTDEVGFLLVTWFMILK